MILVLLWPPHFENRDKKWDFEASGCMRFKLALKQGEMQHIKLCQPLLGNASEVPSSTSFSKGVILRSSSVYTEVCGACSGCRWNKHIEKVQKSLKGMIRLESKAVRSTWGNLVLPLKITDVMTDPCCDSDSWLSGDLLVLIPKMVCWFPGYQSAKVIDGMNSKEFWGFFSS